MRFSSLQLWDWRQYASVDIRLHDRLTVLTGANGSGKTTILHLLARHFGWRVPLISEPVIERSGGLRYLAARVLGRRGHAPLPPHIDQVGQLGYSNGTYTPLGVPQESRETYELFMPMQQPVDGVFLPSHRPPYSYQPLSQISLSAPDADQLFGAYVNDQRSRYTGAGGLSPSHRLKEALVTLAALGYGNKAVVPNPELVAIFEGFEDVLRQLLPDEIGFRGLQVATPEVMLRTATGSFGIDACSGGVAALIDLAWQLYLFSQGKSEYCICIDEPENHLHPTLQRELLPRLMSAFPQSQFVVATHSPLIVTAVEDSDIYALHFDRVEPDWDMDPALRADAKVTSSRLDFVQKARSASDTLRDVLGVEATLPVWAEDRLSSIVDRFVSRDLSEGTLSDLKRELAALGLADYVPSTVAEILRQRP